MPRKHKTTRINLPDGDYLECRPTGIWLHIQKVQGYKIQHRVSPVEARLLLQKAGITHTGGAKP